MKNIVILLITLLTFSTDVLSQSVKSWKTRDVSINMKDGFGFTYCYAQIYSYNKKVNIKKCDTTQFTYEGEKVKSYRYCVDIKLREIAVINDCSSTLAGKYDIKKCKVSLKDGEQYVYIVCKSKNKIKKFFICDENLTITTYDKKIKNTIVSVNKYYGTFAKCDDIHKMKYNNNIEILTPQD